MVLKSLTIMMASMVVMPSIANAIVESDWKCSTLEDGATVICYDKQSVELFGNNSTETITFYVLSGKPISATVDCQKRTIFLVGDSPDDTTTKNFGDETLMSRMCANQIPGRRQFGVPVMIFHKSKEEK